MSKLRTPPPRAAYHHGNAKVALLEAAKTLIEAEGAAGLSLRQVAEHAGLSRQAPYNHFSDKEALLAELAREGFEDLQAAIVAVSTPGKDTLAEAGAAYIGFAERSPALFRLMFSRELVDLSRFPDAKSAANRAFGALSAIVSTIASPFLASELGLAAWSIVHGYATLSIEGQIDPGASRSMRAGFFAQIIRSMAKAPSIPRGSARNRA